ncbi:MAG: S1 RNA-binding domain-containing protein [Oscillibacter sp.]|nr:S1 RNA-binding domain-containing protein [Oscillibacter sp.]
MLTIDARDRVQTEEDREEVAWHEVRNAYRTRRILTGILGGVEQTKSGRTLAIVDYKGFRVAIPILEMMLHTGEMPSNREYQELMGRLNRMLSTMLGAEIDFMVKGIDSNTRSIVASRKDAMLRKRQNFYMDTDERGEHLIYEGRVVQARVIAVAEKIIRVEAFGVECAIVARDLSWAWLGDARDHFSVGSRILIRIQTIDRSSLEGLTITADVRSVSSTTNLDNVKKCQPQCRYAGRVTDVRSGVVYIRLNNGVNAIAHACYDLRAPGKKDDVSFAVTRLDEEKGIAIGIITRIIKQNL